ncbi:restriction endonuclease subunit S [Schleiferilactobacillus harbinensis]|uniref:Restriction endonuclease subunit S n=2 Tax=Schleiferilactobacillus harbinensis TaxID=304207 RepID=A0ABU7T111_9LACO
MTSKKQRRVPELRFRGYTDDWEQRKLSSIVTRVTRKNTGLVSDLPLTISAQDGLVDQVTYFNKRVASKNMEHYLLLLNGEFAYNKSYSKDYPWGAIKRLDMYPRGALSTLYIAFKPTSVNSEFLVAYYETSNWYKQVSERAAEGARNHGLLNIAPHDFFDTRLLIPKTDDEQRSIGLFIKKLDHTIALHQRKQSLLKKLKQGYLQKLFPQKGQRQPELRFPGFTDDWEQRKLGQLSECVRGNDGRMNLPTLTISAGSGWLDQRDRFSQNIAGAEQKNYTLLRKGQLSYNHGNSKLAKFGAVFELRNYSEALVPRVYHSFDVSGHAVPAFIEYLFATKLPDRELAKLVSSGARMDGLLNINYQAFMGIELRVPSIHEQQLIAEFLEALDNTIALHQQEIDRLQELKQGYLQKMFV